ncbi:MAG TPA: MoaD/ThiS family protein [Steroidobacteraceae bacterium]|jgi:molybdopterin converting factor subunit 1
MPRVQLRYYALLREQAGRTAETVDSRARTPGELYAELAARHGFRLAQAQVRVAVNSAFADWDRALADGDEVVFIPPVAGG